jgi:hypothetical protein
MWRARLLAELARSAPDLATLIDCASERRTTLRIF